MKTSENLRRIDDLGRIVLPMNVRKSLRIENKDMLEIFVENDRILLKKREASCILCGNRKDLLEFKGKHVCRGCKSEAPSARLNPGRVVL